MSNSNRNATLLAILLGTFIVPVNSTMITVALTSIADSFAISFNQVSWLVTIYLIIMAVTQPLAGRLGDLYGTRRLFLLGVMLFLLASFVCIFANHFAILMIGRAIQAVGGALITPNATAILRAITPKEQLAKTFGLFGFSMSIGAAIGPVVGALLISHWGWQATFWANIPLLTVSFICAIKFLPEIESKSKSKIDIVGAALLAIWLSTTILIITKEAYTTFWMWSIVFVAFVLFIYREKNFTSPLIDFTLFKHASFRSANGAILINNGIMYGTLLLMPLLLAVDDSFTITEISWALFAFSVSISFCSWFGGRLEGKIGRQRTIQLSFASSFVSILLYFYLPSNESLFIVIAIMLIAGIGSGLGVPSMQTASLSAIAKEDSGVASGIYSTFRYIGSTLISALIGMQLTTNVTLIIFLCSAGIGLMIAHGFKEKR